MASGQTLCKLFPQDNEPPATNYATFDTRNSHPVLDFDTTTAEAAVLPRHYGGGWITVYIHAMLTSATTGTLGWLVAFERMSDATTDLDTDSFASDNTVTAATVPGTSGVVQVNVQPAEVQLIEQPRPKKWTVVIHGDNYTPDRRMTIEA